MAFVTTSGQDVCNHLLLHRQRAHLISQGLLMRFDFLFRFGQRPAKKVVFWKEKVWSTIIHGYTESTIDYLLHFYKVVSLFFSPLWLIFCFCVLFWVFFHHRRSNNSTPELYRLWKMYIGQKSSSPSHFLYGEKLLVWREYFEFDWIFSNIENEIKHSQCEN